MSKGTTPRAVRVEDTLWEGAQAVAAGRGESVSSVIREALQAYIDRYSS